MAGQWREIFRAGDYGEKGVYTAADLDAMAANFNEEDQVPIVVGHPKTDSPAWGWISGLRRIGDTLQAREGWIHPAFEKARRERLFKNRSVRIARTKNGPKLLHLGWLGAAMPEVEGLSGAVFRRGGSRTAPTEGTEINFALAHRGPEAETINQEKDMDEQVKEEKKENTEQDERIAALEARIKELEEALAAEKAARAEEQKARQAEDEKREEAEFSAFIDAELIGKGRLPRAKKPEALTFLKALNRFDGTADFSRGDSRIAPAGGARRWFMDFARGLPAADLLSELPGEGAAASEPGAAGPDLTRKI